MVIRVPEVLFIALTRLQTKFMNYKDLSQWIGGAPVDKRYCVSSSLADLTRMPLTFSNTDLLSVFNKGCTKSSFSVCKSMFTKIRLSCIPLVLFRPPRLVQPRIRLGIFLLFFSCVQFTRAHSIAKTIHLIYDHYKRPSCPMMKPRGSLISLNHRFLIISRLIFQRRHARNPSKYFPKCLYIGISHFIHYFVNCFAAGFEGFFCRFNFHPL